MNFFFIRKITKQEKQIKCIYSAFSFFWLRKCRFERLEVHQTCIYSKKTKVLIVKSHKTCIYSKKSKKSKTDFLIVLSICRFGDFSLSQNF